MSVTVSAVFRDGVFHPTGPLSLADGTAVELAVTTTDPRYDAALRRMDGANTLTELWDVAAEAAAYEPDDGYDIIEALNRNRLEAGERPLIPPESPPSHDQDRAA